MSQAIQVSASILCADFTKLGEEVKKCEKAGIDMIHVDVMDGHFVPNITIGPVIIEAIRPLTKLAIEAHLMVEHPQAVMESFMDAGADIISIQAECYGPLKESCRKFGQYPKEVDSIDADRARKDILSIKKRGKKVFFVVNPPTPLCFNPLLKDIDGVLIMSVNPGFAKQKFIPEVLPKIQELRSRFKGDIAVDGGINNLTAPDVVKAGANILATASYFFGSSDPGSLVQGLKNLRKA
jgi:ribulose-phosphate 3-epimerase